MAPYWKADGRSRNVSAVTVDVKVKAKLACRLATPPLCGAVVLASRGAVLLPSHSLVARPMGPVGSRRVGQRGGRRTGPAREHRRWPPRVIGCLAAADGAVSPPVRLSTSP